MRKTLIALLVIGYVADLKGLKNGKRAERNGGA